MKEFREKLGTLISEIQSAVTQLNAHPIDSERAKQLISSLVIQAGEAAKMMHKWEEEAKGRGE